MADATPHIVEKCDDDMDEQGRVELEGSPVEGDINRNISDPEILEAIMASLREAEDALEEPTKDEMEEDQVIETVEITKMDLEEGQDPEVLDGFVFSDVNESSSPTKGEEVKVDEVAIDDTKKQVLKPATRKRKNSCAPFRAPIPLKKARGRPRKVKEEIKETCDESFSEEEVDVGLTNGDTEYRPSGSGNKSKVIHRNKKSTLKKVVKESVQFACNECSFCSDILGELKIHRHNVHDGCEAPSYLDMAEAAIAQLEDSSGVVEMSIFKEVLFDHFDLITDDKSSASQLLSKALKTGVKLGRLQMSRKGRGQVRFRVVTKERMKFVVEKWRVDPESVELKTSGGKSTLKKNIRNMKKVKTNGGGSIGVKYVAAKAGQDDDEEISILNESLTPKTKLRMMKFSAPQQKVQLVEFLPQNTIPQSPPSSGCYEDDSNSMLTCPVCYCSFWYEDQTVEHMRQGHEGDELEERLDEDATEKKVEIFSNMEDMVKEERVMLGDPNGDINIKDLGDDFEKATEYEEVKAELDCDDNGNMLEHSSGQV